MAKFLEVLKLAFSLLPWIHMAEELFGPGEGAQKKAWILHAVEAGGQALMQRFGVPEAQVAEFKELLADGIDLAVHLAHVKDIFRDVHPDKVDASHVALGLPKPDRPKESAA